MKKRVILLVLVGILSTTMCYAQKVAKGPNGAIIDASAIPHTKVKKARGTDSVETNEGGINGTNTAGNLSSAVSNEKVYYKFEVYARDLESRRWFPAINLCKDLTVDGGNWRMPTYRELVLMWVLKPELEQIEGFVPFRNEPYWSATESINWLCWIVDFQNGKVFLNSKDYNGETRCVRDL